LHPKYVKKSQKSIRKQRKKNPLKTIQSCSQENKLTLIIVAAVYQPPSMGEAAGKQFMDRLLLCHPDHPVPWVF
jgi:hypothetical protein